MKTVAQRLALFALEFDQPMRDVILIQKIVELMSITRATRSQHAQSRKLAIPANSPAPHNECVDDWFAYPWHLGQHAPEFSRRNVQNLGLVRCHSRGRER